MTNIAAHLPIAAQHSPHQLGVVFPEGRDAQGRVAYTHLTFAQLDDESNRIASGLARLGIDKGVRTVLMVKPSLDFFALTFALFKLGAVPVMIDPGMGLKNLKICLGEARPEAFIGIPKAHIARIVLRWPKMRTLVTVGKRAPWGGRLLSQVRDQGDPTWRMTDTSPDDMAAILFTSGSTGVPKGAIYHHRTFNAQVEKLKLMYDIRPGEVDLATFPLFALFAPALGMTAVIPDMDATRPAMVDPAKIFEAVANFGVTNMFGSPALLDRVSRHAGDVRLPSLKRVISAGAPVQPAILQRFQNLLDDAQIHTPYGATESLPVCTIGSHEILRETGAATAEGKGVCVGKPVDGVTLRLIRIIDEAVPEWSDDLLIPAGEIGEITVKGEMVTHGYFNREASTKLAKIRDTDGAVIHRMGDLGYLDDQGRLWFCGRKTHRVTTADGPMFTVPCEGVFNAHASVYRSALVGVPDGKHQKPVICIELEAGAKPANLVAELRELGEAHAHTRRIQDFLIHPEFPVDIRHNAKIFREKLAVWATKQLK